MTKTLKSFLIFSSLIFSSLVVNAEGNKRNDRLDLVRAECQNGIDILTELYNGYLYQKDVGDEEWGRDANRFFFHEGVDFSLLTKGRYKTNSLLNQIFVNTNEVMDYCESEVALSDRFKDKELHATFKDKKRRLLITYPTQKEKERLGGLGLLKYYEISASDSASKSEYIRSMEEPRYIYPVSVIYILDEFNNNKKECKVYFNGMRRSLPELQIIPANHQMNSSVYAGYFTLWRIGIDAVQDSKELIYFLADKDPEIALGKYIFYPDRTPVQEALFKSFSNFDNEFNMETFSRLSEEMSVGFSKLKFGENVTRSNSSVANEQVCQDALKVARENAASIVWN